MPYYRTKNSHKLWHYIFKAINVKAIYVVSEVRIMYLSTELKPTKIVHPCNKSTIANLLDYKILNALHLNMEA